MDSEKIQTSLLRYLSRREYSRYELIERLKNRGFDESLIQEQLQPLTEKNLQSDVRYAEFLTRHRYNQGYGQKAIKFELKQHNISAEVIMQAIKAIDDWSLAAKKAARKKFSLNAVDKAKLQQFLYRRGFENSTIINTLKNIEDIYEHQRTAQ